MFKKNDWHLEEVTQKMKNGQPTAQNTSEEFAISRMMWD
jgi:hypothetical protein